MKGADERTIEKIGELVLRGTTPGERGAAQAALDRMQSKPPLSITAAVTNIDTGNTFYDVSFTHIDGSIRDDVRLPREQFLKPAQAAAELIKKGAVLSTEPNTAGQQVVDALKAKMTKHYGVTSKPGWHGTDSFVYPGQTFGKIKDELIHELLDEDDEALGLSAGTIHEWKEGLRVPCEVSDYLILAIGIKAASPLLDIIGQGEGMLLHLHGIKTASQGEDKTKSSSGKTLTTRVAASMTGRCHKNDLLTFAISERALDDHCFQRNSLGIEFDEEGRSFAGKTSRRVSANLLSYTVTSGRGAVLSTKATRDINLKNRKWTENGISSGEPPLDDPSIRTARHEGEQVRMIGLPVPPGSKGGIFNRVKELGVEKMAKCKALATQIESTVSANYGVAFPVYLEKLVSTRDRLGSRLKPIIDDFVKRIGADGSPWERRFGEKFGLAYAAAVLLAEFGIAPWSEARAYQAIRKLYRKARAATANVEEAAEKLARRLRRRLEKKRYPLIRKGEKVSAELRKKARRGLRWDLAGKGRVLLIPMSDVKGLVQPPAIAASVLKRLAKQKVVLEQGGKPTRQVLINGVSATKRRYVCFDIKSLAIRS
jgi:Domain of unknown function (DUF927)